MTENRAQGQSSKGYYKLAIAVILTLIIVVGIVWLFNNIVNKPRPEIISTYGCDGFQGLNYVIFVDVTVKNNGASGPVVVYAEISGAGKYEKQEQTIYLSSGEQRTVRFTFDVSFWGVLFSQVNYRAWAVAA
jgi:hypothetical protein